VREARAYVALLREAWTALEAVHPVPADANGEVRAWDRAWSRRLSGASMASRCLEVPIGRERTCRDAEVSALVCNLALFDLEQARGAIFREPVPRAADHLDVHVAVADEAARRSAAALSCEDLPSAESVSRDASGAWVVAGGERLNPEDQTVRPTLPPGRAPPPACGNIEETERPVPDAVQHRFAESMGRIRRCFVLARERVEASVLVITISRDGDHRLVDLAVACTLTTGEAATCLRDAVARVAVEDHERIRWWMRFE
jgi:hypothetical protein